jgi:hypothetical protein
MSDSEDEATTEHQLKFVLVGDGTAGKVEMLLMLPWFSIFNGSFYGCKRSVTLKRHINCFVVNTLSFLNILCTDINSFYKIILLSY